MILSVIISVIINVASRAAVRTALRDLGYFYLKMLIIPTGLCFYVGNII